MDMNESLVSDFVKAKIITEICEKHGIEFEKRDFFGRGFYGVCPECVREEHDAKMLAEKAEREQLEIVRKGEYRAERISNSGLPSRFSGKTFADYVVKTPEQESVLSIAKEYAQNKTGLNAGRGLIITGTVGVGKTHLASAIINEVITTENNIRAIYTTARDMIRHIRSAWKNPDIDESDMIDRYAYAQILVIDEIGVQFGSESEMIQMFEVLDKRYGEQLPTVMISNLTPAELTGLLGERIIDRMREDNGVMLQLNWESNRGAV